MDEDQSLEEKEALAQLERAAQELEKITGAHKKYLEVQRIAKEKQKNKLLCNFCGNQKGEVKYLIEGKSGRICNNCIELCYELLKEEEKNEENT
jgi:hypothetical protein